MLKVIVAGSGGIGKTSLLNRLCSNYFNEEEELTKGSDFFVKRLELDGIFVNIQLWDFAGQRQFRFLLGDLTRGAVGAILAFDVIRRSSFFDLTEWVALLRKHIPNLPIVLVATKTDRKYHPTIKREMIWKFVHDNDLVAFVETSSKVGFNVESPFMLLVEHLKFVKSGQ